ncbi:MAG: hypothetical protein ACF8Q5_14650 [Phycisphaerales bacterium JB040]
MKRATTMKAVCGGAVALVALGGCSTVEMEYTGARSYLIEPTGSRLSPGPSLVAGDQLAYRMVLAGAYDAPGIFEGTGYAEVMTDE